MPKQITATTKRFKEQVEALENTGAVKSRQEIIDKIKWNKTGMSLAMQLKDNIPPYIYAEFVKVYNLKTDINNNRMEQTDVKDSVVSAIEHIALQRKHIELQEKHIALLEKQSNSNIEQKLNLFEEALKEILLNSRTGIRNQELMMAVNQQYQEYAIETIWGIQGKKVNGAEVLTGIERKAAVRLLKIEKEGFQLPA